MVSERHREQVVDDGEDDEQRDADAQAPADQLLLDRQQRLDLRFAKFLAEILFATLFVLTQLASGGFTPAKNSHEIRSPTQITKPNRLTR